VDHSVGGKFPDKGVALDFDVGGLGYFSGHDKFECKGFVEILDIVLIVKVFFKLDGALLC
jgi:hypothetical protein